MMIRPRKPFVKIKFEWKISLFSFLCLWLVGSFSAYADSIACDTAANPTVDTVHFIVYDYSKGTLAGNQQLPFDRPFTLKVINIPDSVHITGLLVHEIEPRVKKWQYKQTTAYPTHPPLSRPKDTAEIQDRRILKCKGPSPTPNKGELNFVVGNLVPNRNYYFDFRPDSGSTSLSAQQKKDLIAYLIDTLENDVFTIRIFNTDMQRFYAYDSLSYSDVSSSVNSLNKHFKQLVTAKNQKYLFVNNLSALQIYGNEIDSVRTLRHLLNDTSLKDAALMKRLDTVSKKFDPPFSWYGLNDSATQADLDSSIGNILKQKSDTLYLKKIIGIISSISKFVDTIKSTILPTEIANGTQQSGGLLLSYYLDVSKNAQRNVTIDLGIGYSPAMSNVFLYTMINIYFRPIDKNLPLWNTNYTAWDFLASRLSLAVGLTLTSVDKAHVRTGIVGSDGILLGTGFRLLPWFKITAGTLLYHGLNQNPLISSNPNLRWTGFASLSIDVDVKSIFGSFPVINDLLFK